ncbi:hypothetical protein [Flavipsychrobacter stenotrophus]|uniref:hypothetical protein n=1 Tax=Flavipsychrobacter stenotrophus TaxID=2077091 RepID=UPI001F0BC99F|nr:hypothetical protein [Flavipsychrobacter stenotrophus]
MDQVVEFFSGILDTSSWPPRWHCGRWTDFHGWLYIISDLLVFSAYFTMPVLIVRYIAKQTSARFHKIYFLFAAFILACGFTHLLDAITFWHPVYRLSAIARFITGIISWVTVYYLIRLLPTAFSLKTAAELAGATNKDSRAGNEKCRAGKICLRGLSRPAGTTKKDQDIHIQVARGEYGTCRQRGIISKQGRSCRGKDEEAYR